jgi:hypothetical protein
MRTSWTNRILPETNNLDYTTGNMAQSQENVVTDLDLMRGFVANQKGEAPPAPSTPPPAAVKPAAPVVEQDEDHGDNESGLDAATLTALGLGEEEDSPSPDGEASGTPQHTGDLEALAKTLGLDPEDLSVGENGYRIKTKVDGEVAEVSLADLRKGYQLQRHFTKQQDAFLAERQQWESARQQQAQALQSQEAVAAEILNAEEQALKQKFTRNDWDQLRADDPAEYAALVAEYNQRLGEIRAKQARVHETLQRRQQEAMQALQQRSQQEARLLSEKLGWKDQESVSKGAQALRHYLIGNLGFSEQDVDTTVDHRSFILADKARRYDELMAKVELHKKQTAKAPKMPSGRGSKTETGGRAKLMESQRRLAKDHSLESAAEVFKHLKVI